MSTLATKTEKGPIILVGSIILFICSFFMPFVIVYLIQDTLIHFKSPWFYVTPPAAYITFMIGMAWIPTVMIVYLILNYKYEFKYLKVTSLFLAALCIPVFMYATAHYYYFDDKGLHYNHLESFNKISDYDWASMKEVNVIYGKQNTTYLMEYKFITKDDFELIIPYEGDFKNNEARILQKLKANNVKITDNYADQYE
ncbi:hypothetical protein A8F94_00555 [Bacillus sp. FJAT-27225]|uniref:hypothetical protein n=1 Tax=Bacillus sp. FJAT-27225 TaxID=1743144 RepID=UPI00080C280D|nr:hypothetical protein [Bacillus sp. FJAT-27225]OCA90418.1 hypothetical protein A8F94_00555 [Bacillus sp. FJAT-27225]